MWPTRGDSLPAFVLGFVAFLAFAAVAHGAPLLLDAESMRDAREGLDHLYHDRPEPARAAFERIRARHPESPAPDFLLGGIDWHHLTTGPSGFQAGGPAQKSFFARMDAAIRLGEAALERDKDDVAARFFLGGAYGYKARYLALQEKWWDAYRTGQRGVKHLERVVKKAPELADAYLGLGIYHYYSDVLPSVLKLFAGLIGVHGDRERGLAEIRRALQDGELVSVEARFFLAEIYVDLERDAWSALAFSRSLRDEFPENELFTWMNARVLDEMHLSQRAITDWRVLQSKPRRASHRGFLRYRLARSALFGGDFEHAAQSLEKELAARRLGSNRIMMWGHLRYGEALDFLGRHEDALVQYERAKELDASDSAKERASDRLGAGRRDPSVISLRELAEVARILKETRRHDEEDLRRIEDAVTGPPRGLSSRKKKLYFTVLRDLAEARLRRGDSAGCLSAIARALDLQNRPPKEERSRLLTLRARAHLRRGDLSRAEKDLGAARSRAAYDDRDRVDAMRSFVHRLAARRLPPEAHSQGEVEVWFRSLDRGEILLEVEGDFLPPGQRLPLTLEDGLWVGSYEVPAGRALRYRFLVDGETPRVDPEAPEIRWETDAAWCYRSPGEITARTE